MNEKEQPWLRAVAEPGLPSRRRGRGGAMGTTSQNIFDVLYEAGEPLGVEAITARTWERATSAAQGYALRKARDRRDAGRHQYARKTGKVFRGETGGHSAGNDPREAWGSRIRELLRGLVRYHSLLLDEQGRYVPNPDKPPIAERVDGSTYRYSRAAWLETTQEARTTGEIHTMTMEAEHFLGDRSRDELLLVLEVFVDALAGFGKDKRRPLDPRTVRSQLRWLLERPTTDASRAWLLHELTRRIYETTSESSLA